MIGLIIGLSLSLDAFCVAVLKGLIKRNINIKYILTIALYFGIFQGIMPILGYLIGNSMYDKISLYDHYIILILLSILGINMMLNAYKDNDKVSDNINFKEMFILAVATSLDAFTVGITFTFLTNNILLLSFIISLITFCISFLGVIIGHKFGTLFNGKVEIIGGVMLIFLAIKIFLEHIT